MNKRIKYRLLMVTTVVLLIGQILVVLYLYPKAKSNANIEKKVSKLESRNQRLDSKIILLENNYFQSLKIGTIKIKDNVYFTDKENCKITLRDIDNSFNEHLFMYYSNNFCQSCITSLLMYISNELDTDFQKKLIIITSEKNRRRIAAILNEYRIECECLFINDDYMFRNYQITPSFFTIQDNMILNFHLYSKEFFHLNEQVLELLLTRDL
jgi:hypothetical protein